MKFCFFFFQAEDGIRDYKVTGVQTCALPIFLTDNDAWFLKTDCPDGFKHFERSPLSTSMEGDFDTGNVRFKARERYSFGFSNPRCVFASQGA